MGAMAAEPGSLTALHAVFVAMTVACGWHLSRRKAAIAGGREHQLWRATLLLFLGTLCVALCAVALLTEPGDEQGAVRPARERAAPPGGRQSGGGIALLARGAVDAGGFRY